jgi:hypothetical protein
LRTRLPERKVNEMRARLTLFAVVVAALASLGAGTTAPERAPGTKPATTVSKPSVKPKPARTLSFDPLKIEGHVPRPKAIYTLERSRTTFGDLEPDDDFTPKILESVEGEPF